MKASQLSPMTAAEQRFQLLKEAEPNTWIALSRDESTIVGRGSTYEEAVNEATRQGVRDPLIVKTPPDWNPSVF
jgi:hypothetical protein